MTHLGEQQFHWGKERKDEIGKMTMFTNEKVCEKNQCEYIRTEKGHGAFQKMSLTPAAAALPASALTGVPCEASWMC